MHINEVVLELKAQIQEAELAAKEYTARVEALNYALEILQENTFDDWRSEIRVKHIEGDNLRIQYSSEQNDLAYTKQLRRSAKKFIEEKGYFVHVRQIFRAIRNSFDLIAHDKLRKDLSSALSIMKSDDDSEVTIYKAGSHRSAFWGLESWIGDNGQPLEDRMYERRFLSSNHPDSPYHN